MTTLGIFFPDNKLKLNNFFFLKKKLEYIELSAHSL